ncbi:hypothetical protein [Streptomyces antimicrobicus]|uniref:Uncharacterized protein n=1 Tax=Streptomyces antimicrobicus TaxID=2883108 RepID=A0ABS8BCU9_9ACTN|nr:hypothetical protein [Streptomyces antimicrobicus]MCB5182459.1 hypothetical protein [Streptomyces antimicrobicus]
MGAFNQQGQQVHGKQINIEGGVHGGLHIGGGDGEGGRGELMAALNALLAEITRAKDGGALPEELALDVQHEVTQATAAARRPDAEASAVTNRLNRARGLLSGVTAAAAVTSALSAAIATAQALL